MNPLAIQSIWQAIRESERSDDLSSIDALTRLTQLQPDRPGATDREPIASAAIEPLRAVTLPLLARP